MKAKISIEAKVCPLGFVISRRLPFHPGFMIPINKKVSDSINGKILPQWPVDSGLDVALLIENSLVDFL